jgi:hypothetical protein
MWFDVNAGRVYESVLPLSLTNLYEFQRDVTALDGPAAADISGVPQMHQKPTARSVGGSGCWYFKTIGSAP